MTNSINVYPSTYDSPPIIAGASPETDALRIVENARKRYAKYGSEDTYLNRDEITGRVIEVCAVGAVIAADGKGKQYSEGWDNTTTEFLEQRLSTAARTAMRLLDEKALELFPVSSRYERTAYVGPLEYVNQSTSSGSWESRQAYVLSVYDAVIADLSSVHTEASNA
jgi:hypothetical protein